VNDEVRYRCGDGGELRLPLFLEGWVCVPRELLAHEPGLVWCSEYQEADVLSASARELLGEIEITGRRLDPEAGVLLVPRRDWERRFPAHGQAAARPVPAPVASAATGVVPLSALAWRPAGNPVDGAPSGGARRCARTVARLGRDALDLGRSADVYLAASWIGQLLLGGLNLIVVWATLGWARGAWGSTSGTDVMGGLLLAGVALLVGGAAQRPRHGERGHLAPATLAHACGVICLALVAVVLVLAFLELP
jgi:hypothetical protein